MKIAALKIGQTVKVSAQDVSREDAFAVLKKQFAKIIAKEDALKFQDSMGLTKITKFTRKGEPMLELAGTYQGDQWNATLMQCLDIRDTMEGWVLLLLKQKFLETAMKNAITKLGWKIDRPGHYEPSYSGTSQFHILPK